MELWKIRSLRFGLPTLRVESQELFLGSFVPEKAVYAIHSHGMPQGISAGPEPIVEISVSNHPAAAGKMRPTREEDMSGARPVARIRPDVTQLFGRLLYLGQVCAR